MRRACAIFGILMAFAFAALARQKPDPAKSKIVMKQTAHGVQISITPRDRAGNYFGPGYADHFDVKIDSGSATAPVDPNNDGTYVVTITYPKDDPPNVTITCDGVSLVTERPKRKKKD